MRVLLVTVVFIRLNMEFSLYRDDLLKLIRGGPEWWGAQRRCHVSLLMDRTTNSLASVFNHCCYSHFFFQLCQNNEDEMFKTVFIFSLLMMHPPPPPQSSILRRKKNYHKTWKLHKTNKASVSLFLTAKWVFMISSQEAVGIITSKSNCLPQTWPNIRLGGIKKKLN